MRFALLLAFFCLFCPCVKAQYASFSQKTEQRGLSAVFFPTDRIDGYFFLESEAALRIVDEGDLEHPRYGSLAKAMEKSQLIAGVNGGYFGRDPQGSPIGLVRSCGHNISPFSRGKSFNVSGILYDTGKGVKLERSQRVSTPISLMKEGIQGGPFLVEYGRAVKGLDSIKRARRTFIATDGKGKWYLGVSSPLTLRELSEWLATPKALGAFNVLAALNLDGGTSSAFRCGNQYIVANAKRVRNYVGIVKRPPGNWSSHHDNKRRAK